MITHPELVHASQALMQPFRSAEFKIFSQPLELLQDPLGYGPIQTC
jgi:hypothetical protein